MKYGRYEVVSEIGRGAMGVVFQAHDPQIDRLVALKVLREDRLSSDDYVKRFLKEATAVGRLSHRSIVTVYDIGQDHGTIYIAMELLEGTPLDEILKEQGLGLEDIYLVGSEVAEALHYAHKKGIVHRDIKPANILCTENNEVKVTDFGIAHIEDPDGQQLTQAGEILGTPIYMSPEQVLGQPVDGRSDIYSLGVILYELTTGRRPFSGENLGALFNAITNDPVEPPARVNPEVPRWFSEVIMKALAREPAHRYSNGESLSNDIKNGRNRPQKPAAAAGRPKRRRGLVPAAMVIMLCLAGGGAAYYFLPSLLNTGKKIQPATKELVVEPGSESDRDPIDKSSDPEAADSSEVEENTADTEPVSEKIVLPPVKEKKTEQVKIAVETPAETVPKPVAEVEQPPKVSGSAKPEGGQEPPLDDDMGIFSNSAFEPDRDSEAEPPPETLESRLPKAVPGDREPPSEVSESRPPKVIQTEDAPQEKEGIQKEVKVASVEKKDTPAVMDALLKMKSRPQGADIYIDGEYKGKTPAELKVSAEKHEIKIMLEGHGDWKAQLDLRKGGEIPLSVRLLPD